MVVGHSGVRQDCEGVCMCVCMHIKEYVCLGGLYMCLSVHM